jgi:hypothetical protein
MVSRCSCGCSCDHSKGESGRRRGWWKEVRAERGLGAGGYGEGGGMAEARTHGRVFIRHYRIMWTVPMTLDHCHDTKLVFCQKKKSSRSSGNFLEPGGRDGEMWGQGCFQNTRVPVSIKGVVIKTPGVGVARLREREQGRGGR